MAMPPVALQYVCGSAANSHYDAFFYRLAYLLICGGDQRVVQQLTTNTESSQNEARRLQPSIRPIGRSFHNRTRCRLLCRLGRSAAILQSRYGGANHNLADSGQYCRSKHRPIDCDGPVNFCGHEPEKNEAGMKPDEPNEYRLAAVPPKSDQVI
jgi:hypothetical protein